MKKIKNVAVGLLLTGAFLMTGFAGTGFASAHDRDHSSNRDRCCNYNRNYNYNRNNNHNYINVNPRYVQEYWRYFRHHDQYDRDHKDYRNQYHRYVLYDRDNLNRRLVLQNFRTGPNSQNINTVKLVVNHDFFEKTRRYSNYQNFDIRVNTGNNTIRMNTIVGDISTGDVSIKIR